MRKRESYILRLVVVGDYACDAPNNQSALPGSVLHCGSDVLGLAIPKGPVGLKREAGEDHLTTAFYEAVGYSGDFSCANS